MPFPRSLRRAALLLGGLVLGFVLFAGGAWLYLRSAHMQAAGIAIVNRVALPPEVFQLEEVSPTGIARVVLRDVALLGRAGDTLAAAPVVRARLDLRTLGGTGPILLSDVLLQNPLVYVVRSPSGELNLTQVFRVQAGGQDVQVGEEGQPVLLRDVRIRDGRFVLALPPSDPDSGAVNLFGGLPLARFGNNSLRVATLRGVDAVLPSVRFGGSGGLRVSLARLDARLAEPALPVALRDVTVAETAAGYRFDINGLLLGDSRLALDGTVNVAADPLQYSVAVRAETLRLADLQFLVPELPEEGRATFTLDAATQPGDRLAVTVRDLALAIRDSRVTGRLSVVTGGDGPLVFRDTRLVLDPLELATLEALELGDRFPALADLPVQGRVTGTIATTADGVEGGEGALRLDLLARLSAKGGPRLEPSVIAADGLLVLGGEDGVRFRDLRLNLQPLHLGLLAAMLPEQRERLRGVLNGGVTLNGTLARTEFSGGNLTYQVADAPATRLAGISGFFQQDPLRYRIEASARPLAMATLVELFPGLPFRSVSLTGPIQLSGTASEATFAANLDGASGGLNIQGSVALGEPLRFDVSGSLEAFTVSALLRQDVPVNGPVSGTFALRGTTEDLRFNVDLAQGDSGRFALQGRLRGAGGEGAPQFDVSGNVSNFRLGMLIGQPGLFAAPFSGRVQLAGGGREPYRFDVDLRSEVGVVDVEGFYRAGDIPAYAVAGTVTGLDLRRLPGAERLPTSNLTFAIDLQGRGTTPETLDGRLSLLARESTVAGLPLEAARAQMAVRNGVLVIDTLALAYAGTRLTASGTWGLTRPVQDPLRFAFSADDLSTLTPVFTALRREVPQLEGALNAQGTVAGSLEQPTLAVSLSGTGLRYETWQFRSLAARVSATRLAGGWVGEAAVEGENAVLAGRPLEKFSIAANGGPDTFTAQLAVTRDGQSDIAAAGQVELIGTVPGGLRLESLNFRIADMGWELAAPSAIRWTGVRDGLLVENLLLQRTGDAGGWLQLDGHLPPTGTADLRFRAAGVQLAMLREFLPSLPDVQGAVALEAVVEGPVGSPELLLDAHIAGLRYGGVGADTVQLNARYAAQRLVVTGGVWAGGDRIADIDAQVPMQLSLQDLVPSFTLLETEPLQARLLMDSVPVALLTAAIPQVRDGQGRLVASVDVAGTPASPTFQGWAEVRNAAFTVDTLGVRYRNIDARLDLENETVRLTRLVVRNEGTARAEGTIRFDRNSEPLVNIRAALDGFQAINKEGVARMDVSGDVTLAGRFPQAALTGRLLLDNGQIAIPDIEESTPLELADLDVGAIGADTVSQAAIGPGILSAINVDGLEVRVGEAVWLQSRQARIQVTGDLVVYRSGDATRVSGDLRTPRGSYTLSVGPLVREFDIVRGQVQFFGTPDLNPALDIVAAHRVRGLQTAAAPDFRVLVQITGTAESPRVQLTSETNPPLPESELLSYLIFGQPTTGGLEEVGQQLTGELLTQELLGGLFAPIEQALLQLGLPIDYVRIRGVAGDFVALNPFGTTTVELGAQVRPDVFFTLECPLNAAGFLVGGNGQLQACGTGLEWQVNSGFTARVAWEPVQQAFFLRRLRFRDVRRQFSVELERQWQYGRSEEPEAEAEPARGLPGRVAPPPPPDAEP